VFTSFDIFHIDADGHAAWLMSAPSLQTACKLVEQLAASQPGEYFLFGQQMSHKIAVSVLEETFNNLNRIGTQIVH
jgi:hypothetical protein